MNSVKIYDSKVISSVRLVTRDHLRRYAEYKACQYIIIMRIGDPNTWIQSIVEYGGISSPPTVFRDTYPRRQMELIFLW